MSSPQIVPAGGPRKISVPAPIPSVSAVAETTQKINQDLLNHINTVLNILDDLIINGHLQVSMIAGYDAFLEKAQHGMDKIREEDPNYLGDNSYLNLKKSIEQNSLKRDHAHELLDQINKQIVEHGNEYIRLTNAAKALDIDYKPKPILEL